MVKNWEIMTYFWFFITFVVIVRFIWDRNMLEVWYGSFVSRARAHQVYAPKRHKHPIFGFGRILAFLVKKYFASNVPYVCKYLACARGIWKFNTWWVFDRYFIPPKNSKILVRFYLRNWRFLDKKCQNFKNFWFAQNDPISLLNPWNRFI